MTTTIKDIAARANVSVATVSRYLNNNSYVSENTRRMIAEIIAEFDYTPKHYNTRKKKRKEHNAIGIIIPEQNIFFQDIVQALQDEANHREKSVIICISQERSDIEIMNLETMYNLVGGLIVVPVSQTRSYNEEFILDINKEIPVVLVDRDISSNRLDAVFSDSYQGAYDGVMALIREGHTKIGLLAGTTTAKPGLERLNGYLQALKDSDISVREEFIIYGDFRYDNAYTSIIEWLKNGLPVTAMFSSSYIMTLGCMKAFEEYDIKIPQDISFISFDNFPLFESSMYKMSCIVNPGYPLGEEAANILFSRLSDANKDKRIYLRRTVVTPYVKLRGSEKFVCPER